MELANFTLLMVCMICIQFLSLPVFADKEENSENVSSEPFKAYGCYRFRVGG